MNVTAIIIAALVVGAVGIILGFFLGISGEKFKLSVEIRIFIWKYGEQPLGPSAARGLLAVYGFGGRRFLENPE